jgi:Na+-transporting NADH:ubiquinone oxidoreductase subunit NqrB
VIAVIVIAVIVIAVIVIVIAIIVIVTAVIVANVIVIVTNKSRIVLNPALAGFFFQTASSFIAGSAHRICPMKQVCIGRRLEELFAPRDEGDE